MEIIEQATAAAAADSGWSGWFTNWLPTTRFGLALELRCDALLLSAMQCSTAQNVGNFQVERVNFFTTKQLETHSIPLPLYLSIRLILTILFLPVLYIHHHCRPY